MDHWYYEKKVNDPQQLKKKASYKILNWQDYNKGLSQRKVFSNYINHSIIASWNKPSKNQPEVGRFQEFSDEYIVALLEIKYAYGLTYPELTGFVKDEFAARKIKLKVPSASQICKRAKKLTIALENSSTKLGEIAIDSTGLKVYGVGEWYYRQHGRHLKGINKPKRRLWKKVHLLVDVNTMKIVGFVLTSSSVADCKAIGYLFSGVTGATAVYGDGAYSSEECFEIIARVGGLPKIALSRAIKTPKSKGEKKNSGSKKELKKKINSKKKKSSMGKKLRDKLAREINRAGGKEEWKKKSDYHRRSLIETTMFRLKILLGDKLSSRTFATQATEIGIKMRLLNKFTDMGKPLSNKNAA